MSKIDIGLKRAKLTDRQIDVLEGISLRKSIKLIAFGLGISESAVNQHIKTLKSNLSATSLAELAEVYRSISEGCGPSTYRKAASRKKHLPERPITLDLDQQVDSPSVIAFHEPLSYEIRPPWETVLARDVGPGVLNGVNATWVRGAAIVLIAAGLLATIMIGLGVAQGVTTALESVQADSLSQN